MTLVLPQQDEINYQTFMYTMYTSPSGSLREMAAFYDSDLKTEILQFVPGPGNDTLTTIRLLNSEFASAGRQATAALPTSAERHQQPQ